MPFKAYTECGDVELKLHGFSILALHGRHCTIC